MAHNERKTLYKHTYSGNTTISACYNIKFKIRELIPFQQTLLQNRRKCNQDLGLHCIIERKNNAQHSDGMSHCLEISQKQIFDQICPLKRPKYGPIFSQLLKPPEYKRYHCCLS